MKDKNELDLLDVLSFFLRFVKSYAWIIVSLFTLSLIVSYGIYFSQKDEMTSSITLNARTLDFTEVEPLAESLLHPQQMISAQGSDSSLNFSKRQISLISKIQLSEVHPHPAERKKGCQFKIIVDTEDTSVFSNLSSFFVNYLNDRPFVKKRIDERQNFLNNTILQYNRQISRLDSLIKFAESELKLHKSKVVLSGLFSELAELERHKERTIYQLQFSDEFRVFSNFSVTRQTYSLRNHLFAGLLSAIGLILLLFIYKGFAKLLQSRKEKSHPD